MEGMWTRQCHCLPDYLRAEKRSHGTSSTSGGSRMAPSRNTGPVAMTLDFSHRWEAGLGRAKAKEVPLHDAAPTGPDTRTVKRLAIVVVSVLVTLVACSDNSTTGGNSSCAGGPVLRLPNHKS